MLFSGRVLKGKRRGTALGYPTANIALVDSSVSGIYAARVTINGASHYAAAFADPRRGILEAHVLDFSGDLYGAEIEIEIGPKIRESSVFSDDEELKRAIERDVAKVRECFKN